MIPMMYELFKNRINNGASPDFQKAEAIVFFFFPSSFSRPSSVFSFFLSSRIIVMINFLPSSVSLQVTQERRQSHKAANPALVRFQMIISHVRKWMLPLVVTSDVNNYVAFINIFKILKPGLSPGQVSTES